MEERQHDNVLRYLRDRVYPEGAEKSEKYVLRRLAKNFKIKAQKLYYVDKEKDGSVLERLVIRGQSNVKAVLEECHSSAAGGHRGREGTATKVRQRYYWPGYYKDCIQVVKIQIA